MSRRSTAAQLSMQAPRSVETAVTRDDGRRPAQTLPGRPTSPGGRQRRDGPRHPDTGARAVPEPRRGTETFDEHGVEHALLVQHGERVGVVPGHPVVFGCGTAASARSTPTYCFRFESI